MHKTDIGAIVFKCANTRKKALSSVVETLREKEDNFNDKISYTHSYFCLLHGMSGTVVFVRENLSSDLK